MQHKRIQLCHAMPAQILNAREIFLYLFVLLHNIRVDKAELSFNVNASNTVKPLLKMLQGGL